VGCGGASSGADGGLGVGWLPRQATKALQWLILVSCQQVRATTEVAADWIGGCLAGGDRWSWWPDWVEKQARQPTVNGCRGKEGEEKRNRV